MKIQSKAEQSAAIAAASKLAIEAQAKAFGAPTTFYGTVKGEYPFNGQPKGYGVLMGAYTLAVLNVAGFFTLGKDDKAIKAKGPVCGRAFEVLCAGAFDHWTNANKWATSKGLTDAGFQMVAYRLGQVATAPTKTGASTGKTSASLVREMATLIAKGPGATGEAHIKDAMIGVKLVGSVFGKVEPFNADRAQVIAAAQANKVAKVKAPKAPKGEAAKNV